ncbi:phosphoribosylformylglycinamidine cyclo-ligase [Paraclostridium bifermentans]|uniref:Phosphoribosylformylglycinamidine cyclo-ligase n=1 Tax=Paraclostridium bifermentans TaxID=1490 RepID=A0A5P3XH43_PARBF|nr:phosphoribosylformylglycinamidine cyclo-ligase [Paraclostridium bifermentans]MCE9676535.1 phosphoribosylformylglycinamidine cyclo-ligase [Paraclostridium bifermentans]QEZ69487.1 phosphoribosylformylglycinamidine cyclo-ligase [Paraclostridium bifermentans]QEZ69613.1 phosphoribosylformylglycinamidine cyclo-ligase [Paraclostridium bifermentans]TQO59428.1 phosphoribosylformylglycinamidine cyclo-ligase [Paraclostridium bifermentans]GKZ04565.1 phosphoribosylformylglycinamidine cyclo-ligase [Parac
MLTYRASGVDIDEGNRAVNLIKDKIKGTYDKNVIGDLGNFSGLYSLKDFINMDEPVLLSSTDGVGTKLKLAQMMDIHNTVGIDLVAMCVNDLICQGAKPLFFLDYIATGKLIPEKIDDIVSGIVEGCKMAECALIGGETAEMPGMYSEDDYDLAGFSVGIADKSKIISGQDVNSGDTLIGISSSGIHSNGYSFIRKIFLQEYKYELTDYIEELGMTLGEALLIPTKIYVKLVMDLIKKYELKAIAHITGGGVIENIPRVIPNGLGIDIEKNSWEKPAIFKMIEKFNAIDEVELHKSFNMGIGLAMVVDSDKAEEIVSYLNESEKQAYIIGKVVDTHEGVKLC